MWENNCWIRIKIRITEGLPKIYREPTEKFPKISIVFVVMFLFDSDINGF